MTVQSLNSWDKQPLQLLLADCFNEHSLPPLPVPAGEDPWMPPQAISLKELGGSCTHSSTVTWKDGNHLQMEWTAGITLVMGIFLALYLDRGRVEKSYSQPLKNTHQTKFQQLNRKEIIWFWNFVKSKEWVSGSFMVSELGCVSTCQQKIKYLELFVCSGRCVMSTNLQIIGWCIACRQRPEFKKWHILKDKTSISRSLVSPSPVYH